MPNYEDDIPGLSDDIQGSADGLRDAYDKGKRARDILKKGHDLLSGGSERESSPGKQDGRFRTPSETKTPNGPQKTDGSAPDSAGLGASSGAEAAPSAGGAATGTGAGSSAGGAVAGGGAAGGGAAGAGAATGGTAAAAGAAVGWPVIIVILVLLVIWIACFFIPKAAGGNQITHFNDGEVLGAQGPNENGEYSWADLVYDRSAPEEMSTFLSSAKRSQRELADYFRGKDGDGITSPYEAAVKNATDAVSTLYDDIDKIIIECEGFDADSYRLDHVFKDEQHTNPALLYVLCAYSASTYNFLGEQETVKYVQSGVEDDDGESFLVPDLEQVDSGGSVFNSGQGATELIIKAFKSAGVNTMSNPNYDYGNIVHGATIGTPEVIEVPVESDGDEDGTEPETTEIKLVRVTIHDIDPVELCQEVFGYNLSDSYENGNFSESSYSNLNFNTTYAETIDDMVTFAGRLILEAGGADPETISFTFGSSANYLSPIISLSGNGSQDMVNTARSFLENVGGAQFKKWYPLSPTSAWCACFVSYVADQCGYIDAGIIPKFCGCDAGKNWFVANGLYKSADSGYIPRPGDIVFYASPSNMGHMKHVGIVVSAESADVVHTIEGNTSKPGNPSAPYGVYEKTRHRNNGSLRIAGYGTPNYPTSSVSGFQSPVGPNWREMVTSEFGNRIDPITHVRKGHNGMDLACPTGTQIHAALDGTVIIAKNQGSYGNYVKIDHGDGLQTLYAHNSRLLVKEGQTVRAGDVIALSGSTGRSTGPHCHFEVWLNGSRTQPRDYLP